MALRVKRAYEPASRGDGTRVLVDRLWPRGLAKDKARIDHWLKEIAPSTALRKWFNHDPAKWEKFRARYCRELKRNTEAVKELRALARGGPVTLVYSARNEDHNQAVALRDYLAAPPPRRKGDG
jgi:uncharacterized protein YeaO (DUF488 family)